MGKGNNYEKAHVPPAAAVALGGIHLTKPRCLHSSYSSQTPFFVKNMGNTGMEVLHLLLRSVSKRRHVNLAHLSSLLEKGSATKRPHVGL